MLRFSTLVLSILLLATTAHAELWIKFDTNTKRVQRRIQGDCFRMNFCEANNTNISPGFIQATTEEYLLAKQPYMKVETSIVGSSRVVTLNQSEKDVAIQDDQDVIDAEKTVHVNNLDISVKDAFVAFLKVYNSKVALSQRVSGAELKSQILEDKGL